MGFKLLKFNILSFIQFFISGTQSKENIRIKYLTKLVYKKLVPFDDDCSLEMQFFDYFSTKNQNIRFKKYRFELYNRKKKKRLCFRHLLAIYFILRKTLSLGIITMGTNWLSISREIDCEHLLKNDD